MSKRMIIMLVVAVVLFGGIFAWQAIVGRIIADVFDNMEQEPVTVSAAQARSDSWTPVTEAVGTFRAIQGANLTVEQGGIVAEIHFENGQRVTAGERLVSLDIRADQAELAQLEAAQRLTDLELARQQQLFEQRSVSRSALDRAESEAEQARATVRARQARIDQKTLRAPFDGRAGIRQVNRGQFLSPGDPVVSVQALAPIFVDFTLPQRQLPRLEIGAPLRVTVDAYDGETFDGEITALEPGLSETTRSVSVQATLGNDDERLRPGMYGRIELDLGEAEDVVVVPQTAIRFSPYGNSVFVIEGDGDDKKVTQRFVQTGATRGDLIVIEDGLEEGEEVASSGLLKLQNNARVRISDTEDAHPSEQRDPTPANG